jgi:hypothetical protein
MKKIKNFFLSLFYYIFNFKKIRFFKDVNKKLAEAVKEKNVKQAELMLEINSVMKSFYPKGRSKFIPMSLKERREIRAAVELQFGKQMQRLNIKINDKLHFV